MKTAGTQRIITDQELQSLFESRSMRERPEVKAGVILPQARRLRTRETFGKIDLQERKPFVITQKHVVFRSVFLDQAGFQNQRLVLIADRNALP